MLSTVTLTAAAADSILSSKDVDKLFHMCSEKQNAWISREGVVYAVPYCGHEVWAYNHQEGDAGGFALECAGFIHLTQGRMSYGRKHEKFGRTQANIIIDHCLANNIKPSKYAAWL